MANTLTFDFRHYYQRGERRESDKIAYQWDLGHVAEIYVPLDATYNISYCFSDYDKTDDYAVESIEAADDGGYKLTAHVPNKYFERSGELRVYIVGEVDDHIITTYEGFLTIRSRLQPDDYIDPDPENGARTDEAQTHVYAQQSEAWAVGTIDGAPVESTDPQYENFSKYYAEQAADSAEVAEAAETSASGSATAASGSASTATTKATLSESYAVGGTGSRTGEDTDNAKYYKEQAEAAAAMLDAEKILGNFASYEETTTASKAYKVGELLTYNGYLYRVTTAIASGGTISVGTNVVQTTVGDEVANKVLRFDSVAITATTGDIATVTDSRITADHVLADCVWGDPSAITTDVTLTTSAGSMVLNGTCSAATTATITLIKKDN